MRHTLRDMEELWEVRLGEGSLVFHLGRGLGGLRKSPRMSRLLNESGHRRQENHVIGSGAGTHRVGLREKKSESQKEPWAEALECCIKGPGGLIVSPERASVLAGSEQVRSREGHEAID